jgi:hypothetical protein
MMTSSIVVNLSLMLLQGLVVTPSSPAVSDSCATDFSVPFEVGERLTYDAYFGPLRAGEGSMEVLTREEVRGREAWHVRFQVEGGVPFYKVNDVLESWIDVRCFHSLRFVQDFEQGGSTRERTYEIFPERGVYVADTLPEQPTVPAPLDDGAFFYFVRTLDLEVGKTYAFHRYFRPDRNPVVIKVLRRERLRVPAGNFNAIVIQPIINSRGIFAEGGEAEIWLSDDPNRIMLQMKTRLQIGSLNLVLKSYRRSASSDR